MYVNVQQGSYFKLKRVSAYKRIHLINKKLVSVYFLKKNLKTGPPFNLNIKCLVNTPDTSIKALFWPEYSFS